MDTISIPNNIKYDHILYKSGSEILWGLDENDSLFFLEKGTADVNFRGIDGESMRIFRYKAPDFWGEVEVLTNCHSQLLITAVEDCWVCRIPQNEALKWMEQDFQFCLRVMHRLCEKLMADTDSRIRLRFHNSRQRYLAVMAQYNKEGTLKQLKKEHLCEELGIPLRSLNRIVAQCTNQYIFHDGHFQKVK